VVYHRPYTRSDVLSAIDELEPVVHESQDTIRQALRQLAPEYTPSVFSAAPQHLVVAGGEDGNGKHRAKRNGKRDGGIATKAS
jgi:hypothetical protein